jgi:hypothetical protein
LSKNFSLVGDASTRPPSAGRSALPPAWRLIQDIVVTIATAVASGFSMGMLSYDLCYWWPIIGVQKACRCKLCVSSIGTSASYNFRSSALNIRRIPSTPLGCLASQSFCSSSTVLSRLFCALMFASATPTAACCASRFRRSVSPCSAVVHPFARERCHGSK